MKKIIRSKQIFCYLPISVIWTSGSHVHRKYLLPHKIPKAVYAEPFKDKIVCGFAVKCRLMMDCYPGFVVFHLQSSLGLNDHHQEQALKVIRFNRFKRSQTLKELEHWFQDLKESR